MACEIGAQRLGRFGAHRDEIALRVARLLCACSRGPGRCRLLGLVADRPEGKLRIQRRRRWRRDGRGRGGVDAGGGGRGVQWRRGGDGSAGARHFINLSEASPAVICDGCGRCRRQRLVERGGRGTWRPRPIERIESRWGWRQLRCRLRFRLWRQLRCRLRCRLRARDQACDFVTHRVGEYTRPAAAQQSRRRAQRRRAQRRHTQRRRAQRRRAQRRRAQRRRAQRRRAEQQRQGG